jgi:ElaB/YqjD/DUF883 family membrane-anchored ribosome-binding protein
MESWIPNVGRAGKVAVAGLLTTVDVTIEDREEDESIGHAIRRIGPASAEVHRELNEHVQSECFAKLGILAKIGFAPLKSSCKPVSKELNTTADDAHASCSRLVAYYERIPKLERALLKVKGGAERGEIEEKLNEVRSAMNNAEHECEKGIKAIAQLGEAYNECQCR